MASICSILNFSDCHNRQRMSVESRASDKFWGASASNIFLAFRATSFNQLVSSPDKGLVKVNTCMMKVG